MHRNRSVNVHQFAMVPKSDVPRSSFVMEHAHKTTCDAGYLIPIYSEEVLPGDTFQLRATFFGRMVTPLFPLMDNLHLDTFFFFVPWRLVWTNFVKMMGEQTNPGDSISYVAPTATCPASGYVVNSLQDYFGLPTVGQVGGGNTYVHNNLYMRAYNLIWNQWFRDENLQNSVTVDMGDGPDTYSNYVLLRRGKRHDYFTSALPWPQKGNTAVALPLGTSAPVYGTGKALGLYDASGNTYGMASDGAAHLSATTGNFGANVGAVNSGANIATTVAVGVVSGVGSGLYADLSGATAATINQIRLAIQTQRFLEKDARGGTRYTELLRSHFGVVSPDARLQRPEYLGGGSTAINISPIAQTSGTGASGTSTVNGTLTGMATMLAHNHGFSQSFVEHGCVIGLLNIRADLTYQQGIPKKFLKSTRYDYFWPVFAHLGEQTVLNKEIYCDGSGNDANAFGYQERYAEYRYHPSEITGLFRSTSAGTLDPWHVAQKFSSLPTLNTTFIQENPPIDRIIAVTSQTGKQFYVDSLFTNRATRAMPMYGVPGLMDHF